MTFHKIYCPENKLNYGWMLLIKSDEDIYDFMEHFQHPEMRNAVKAFKEKQKHPLQHFSNGLADTIWCFALSSGNNLTLQMEELFGSQIKTMIMLVEDGGCYVNPNLGMMPVKGMRILDSCESDVFPNDKNLKIKILQWPHGTHYYAVFGKTEIEEAGDRKWKTFESACNAAKRWYKIIYKKDYNKDFETI